MLVDGRVYPMFAFLFVWGSERAMRITAYAISGVVVGITLLLVAGMVAIDPFVSAQTWGSEAVGGTGTDDEFSPAGVAHPALAMLMRLGVWGIMTPLSVVMLIVPLCVLLGMLAARHRWLEGAATKISLRGAAVLGVGAAVAAAIPAALMNSGLLEVGGLAGLGYVLLSQTMGVLGGIGYVALFALLAARISAPLRGVWVAIAAVGRRSLSCYLMQSIIMSPLLSHWGFGLGARINTTGAFCIAFGVWALSVLAAALLERRSAPGPAEAVLRRLTYGRFGVPQSVGLR